MVEEFAATLALTAVAVHTQQSHLSDGPHPSHTHLELVILPPSCISSRKTLWTASASLRSGSLEAQLSPWQAFVCFSFLQPVLEVSVSCSWSKCNNWWKGPRTLQRWWRCSGPPSSLHQGAGSAAAGPAKKPLTAKPRCWCDLCQCSAYVFL